MTRSRLLAVDLDGTLLDRQGKPHASDVRAIRAAMTSGIRVSVVTGRLYSGTRAVVELLGLRGAVACADGSHLVHARDHSTLLHFGVRGEEALLLRDTLERAGVVTFVFAADAIGYDLSGVPYVDYVATWSTDIRICPRVFEHDLWSTDGGVTAVVALGSREQIASATHDLARDLPRGLVVATFPMRRGSHVGTWALVARALGATKGTAMRWIADRENVALSDTVCVGDWINDLPMFEIAGRSFAMGHSPDEVKAKATDVLTETAEVGGGVARAVAAAFGI